MKPVFSDPDIPRYTESSFPAYRFLPFQPDMPHPRNDPEGHSFGQEEDYLPEFTDQDWQTCQPYLYGIDLFNYGYWWEAHESLEAVWLAAGQDSLTGNFVQGLIQMAAAQLKRYIKQERGAKILTESSIAKLSLVQGTFLGVEVALLIAEAQRCLEENRGEYPQISLVFDQKPPQKVSAIKRLYRLLLNTS